MIPHCGKCGAAAWVLSAAEGVGSVCLMCGHPAESPPEPLERLVGGRQRANIVDDWQAGDGQVSAPRLCICGCGRRLPFGSHGHRKYFSDSCKVRACRKRKAGSA